VFSGNGSGTGSFVAAARVVLYVAAVGVALYLLLPLVPGLGRSADAVARASAPLVVAALAAELCSLLCYSELLAFSAMTAARMRPSLKRRRSAGLGPWFAFRLAVCGHQAGRILPGGWALLAAIVFGTLRRRGFGKAEVGLALASFPLLVYGALGVLCAVAFFYFVAHPNVATASAVAVFGLFVLLIFAALAAYAAYRRSPRPEGLAEASLLRAERLLRRLGVSKGAAGRVGRLSAMLSRQLRVAGEELLGRPSRLVRPGVLALGFWLLDALCLLLVFWALGTGVGPWKLLVAYAAAQVVAAVPFMPAGGLGAAEVTFVSMFALLGMGPETTVIPVLAYRLFNFWMPIPLAAVFYPTLRLGVSKTRARRIR
jgi:uncharacterized membrane protein YbhN (UPF0104 family)